MRAVCHIKFLEVVCPVLNRNNTHSLVSHAIYHSWLLKLYGRFKFITLQEPGVDANMDEELVKRKHCLDLEREGEFFPPTQE